MSAAIAIYGIAVAAIVIAVFVGFGVFVCCYTRRVKAARRRQRELETQREPGHTTEEDPDNNPYARPSTVVLPATVIQVQPNNENPSPSQQRQRRRQERYYPTAVPVVIPTDNTEPFEAAPIEYVDYGEAYYIAGEGETTKKKGEDSIVFEEEIEVKSDSEEEEKGGKK